MRGYIIVVIIVALLVVGGVVLALRTNQQYDEGAARARVYTDCLLATGADAEQCQASTVFDQHADVILACYRADSSTDGFRTCLQRQGIANPPGAS